MTRLSPVENLTVVSCERVFVIHFETPSLSSCNSNKSCKNQTQLKLHAKMSLATPEGKLTGFLAKVVTVLASSSELIYTEKN